MNSEELKYVVGEAHEDQPAIMRFYGRIDDCSTRQFNDEFLWLHDYIKPSKIIVCINSEGGSVLYGMSTFSILLESKIPVETVIDGLAASMASVLWAAGSKAYMRDYSILMIHNPFLRSGNKDNMDPDTQQTVNAFRKQIETIYRKRFGLSKEKVQSIMDGDEGCDGTYFDAQQAVDAGIIPAENILKTSKQVCSKVKNQMKDLTDAVAIQKMMVDICAEAGEIKPQENNGSIPNQNQNEKQNSQEMNKEQDVFAFGSVCAQLGLPKDSEVADVVNQLTELKNAKEQLKTVQASYDALKIEKAGVETELNNKNEELASVKNQLKVYQDAESAAKDAEIESLIDAAVKAGKIKPESKEQWVEMAHSNLETVRATLDSITGREKISEEIATDPANIDNAKDNLTEAQKKLQAEIEARIAPDFQFNTLD